MRVLLHEGLCKVHKNMSEEVACFQACRNQEEKKIRHLMQSHIESLFSTETCVVPVFSIAVFSG